MAEVIEPLVRLSDMFRRLDGVGQKSAMRYAFCVLNFSEAEAREFADAIMAVKTELVLCETCQNISSEKTCPICANPARNRSVICVVEDSRALLAIENTGHFNGTYHVLHGVLSPMKGISPADLKIKELLSRLGNGEVSEVIIATNPTVEGEATAMYLSKLIAPLGIKVSRIANGVPIGGDLEYADEVTLRRAIEGRYELR